MSVCQPVRQSRSVQQATMVDIFAEFAMMCHLFRVTNLVHFLSPFIAAWATNKKQNLKEMVDI
jgi:hypothetical protein